MNDEHISLFAMTFIGVIVLIGSIRKWKWLVDPPENWSKMYSQVRLKKMFGSEFVRIYTLIFSILYTSFSSYVFFTVLLKINWLHYIYIAGYAIFLIFLLVKRIIVRIKDRRDIKKYSKGKIILRNGKYQCNKCGYIQNKTRYCENCYEDFSNFKK